MPRKLPSGAARAPWVTIVDEALPRRAFEPLRRAVLALGSERLRTTYQTTFWFPLSERPENLVEEAAVALLRGLPRRERARLVGVEWWLSRMYTSNVQVDFHLDRDNALFARTGRTVTPRLSSLLYLTKSTGGLLAVTREPANPRNPALAPDVHDFDFVAPTPNRFAFFSGRLTHGVLDANNEFPLRRLPRARSLRVALALNWWHRRPLGVPRWGDSPWYRGLGDGARGR